MSNAVFERTRAFWGSAIQQGNLMYPNDHVIRFVKKNFHNPSEIKILDFGCGGGRNTVALLSEGFDVIAMEYTESATKMTREKCKGMGKNNISIIQNSGFDVPLKDDYIDAIVADGSLFYYNMTGIITILRNLRRVLKADGLIWTDFRTKNDSLYGKGNEIDGGLFEMQDGTDREGCTYYFADEADVRSIFASANLEIVSIDDYTYTTNDRNINNSWFHIVARKGR